MKTVRQDSRDLYERLQAKQKKKVQEELDCLNESMDSRERKDKVLGDQIKDLALDMEGIQATVAIAGADVKDTVTTMEALGARVSDHKLRLDNQQRLERKWILSYVKQTVTRMLTMGILAMDTTDPVEMQVRRQNGPLRDMIRSRRAHPRHPW